MNYSELNNPETNQDIFSNQGMEYIKFRNKKNVMNNNNNNNRNLYGIIEGYDNITPLDDKISKDIEELSQKQKEYNELLNEYNDLYSKTNSKRLEYEKIKTSDYLNKNIRLDIKGSKSRGQIGYITSEGIFKHYPNWETYQNTMNKNGCPKDVYKNVQARNTGWRILFEDKEQPNFALGSPIETNQSCGFEGSNIFVTDSGPVGESKYEGCYNNSSSSGLIKSEYQVPYSEEGFQQCKQFAHDTGNSVFAISRDGNNMNCYVGKDLDKVKKGGLATIPTESWASPQVNGILATLNAAGQLLIKGNGTTQSNLTEGLKCKVYKGYMNDDTNYFKTATVITRTTVNYINNFNDIGTSTNNLVNKNTTTVSVEWIGYVKANVSGNWTFYLNSDDCSYMWIGNNAITEYKKDNVFINNGGLHGARTISRSVALTAGQYYPIRIQFGQNYGPGAFHLKIQKPNGNITSIANGLFFSTPNPFTDPLYPTSGETLETLWQSNDPQGNCHDWLGGKINLTNSNSTWGYNCNEKTKTAWGTDATYNVPLGNMNEIVINNVNNKRHGIITIDGKDPAFGCRKNFNSTYRCGNGDVKSINIEKVPRGATVLYNCNREDNLCNFKLVVQDDGNLVIYNNKTPVWNSETHTQIDLVDESKMASKGKNGRSYLLPGETLNDGEFIGSNNGKCFLKMTKGIGLQLFYNKLNCSNKNNNPIFFPDSNSPSSETLAVYSLPIAKGLESIGAVSYIDSDSKRFDYPANMIKKGITYFNLGNYNDPHSKNIKEFEANDPNACKEECNKIDDCEGFVFGGNKCYLKNNEMYPKSYRYSTPGVELYKRSVYIDNNDESCKKFVNPIGSNQWDSYISSGKEMDSTIKCMLSDYTIKVDAKLNNIINELNNKAIEINNKITSLTENDKQILKDYGIDNDKIKNSILEINKNKTSGKEGFSTQTESKKTPGERFIDTTRELSKLQGDYSESKVKISNLRGMQTTSQLELIHNNYNYMLWSILAVLVVIGGMKILKNKN